MKKEVRKIVRLTNSQGVRKDINPEDIVNMRITQSIAQYADTFDIVLDNAEGKNSKLCESKDEVEVWAGYEGTELKKMMGGYIDRIIFRKDEKSRGTMQLQGRSYASILLDTRISKRMRFTRGYSEVLQEILKDTPLKIDGIVDTEGKGEIIVTNASLIDIVRQFAEDIGWTFRIDYNKVFHFKPFSPPRHAGTITEKDIISFEFIKE